ncbi:MAG: type II toxin-antitoxin system RelE/ParE family toxin [Chitinophagales bacterium]|nr:type II toxin-antitoxin system RelE/ParE family toxin [Chitinophagales bacterium]
MAKIIITNFAKQQLQQIYNYISWKASDTIALKEIERIIKQIEYLEITPKIGRIVEELKILKLQHRQLVVGNYRLFIGLNQK